MRWRRNERLPQLYLGGRWHEEPPTYAEMMEAAVDAAITGRESERERVLLAKWQHQLTHCEVCGLPLSRAEMEEGLCSKHLAEQPQRSTTRTCQTCSKPLPRQQYASSGRRKYIRQGYCDRSCSLGGLQPKLLEDSQYTHVKCKTCGEFLRKKVDVTRALRPILDMGYCSRECGAAAGAPQVRRTTGRYRGLTDADIPSFQQHVARQMQDLELMQADILADLADIRDGKLSRDAMQILVAKRAKARDLIQSILNAMPMTVRVTRNGSRSLKIAAVGALALGVVAVGIQTWRAVA